MTEQTMIPVSAPAAELPDAAPGRAPLLVRFVTAVVIVVPLLGLVAAPFFLWGWGFSWTDLELLIGMYLLTALGITVGFYRLFVHRSFETYTWVKVVFAALGSMAVQGSMFKWVAYHRKHHRHSDTPDDPHTPHHAGGGPLGVLRGAWHAHVGWLFRADPPDLDSYVKDLKKSPALRAADSSWPFWVVMGLLIPGLIGGLVKGSWPGVWTGLIWGGLVRILLVHHVTWSVNSACHLWGWRPYRSEDESRNNVVFGILALGEGWHNAHHAFPTSARHGLRWWQIDASYYLIRGLAWSRLAWDVRLPTAAALERARPSRSPTADAEPPRAGDATDPPPAVAPVLLAAFWVLIGAAAGIELTQGLWSALGLDAGRVSVAVPVGAAAGALVAVLLSWVTNPRALVLLMGVFAGASAGGVTGGLMWGGTGEVIGQAVGALTGGLTWAVWLLFHLRAGRAL